MQAPIDASSTPDAMAAPDASKAVDAAPTTDQPSSTSQYPPGPYGSRVCARFEPFTLNRCNGEPWSFAENGWSESPATVIILSAVWCVPCQREAQVLEAQLVQPYADRNVRVVTVLVQNSDRTAITPNQCMNNWQNRYRLTHPVLMDPQQTLAPFYPGLAFPGNLIVDRQGRIRFRQFGSEMQLTSIRAVLDEVLANPDTCTP
jgi:thiol-disulfide isomerase/thioredoxin